VKSKRVILGVGVSAGLALYSVFLFKFQQKRLSEMDLKDKALLSILKNDLPGFKAYLAAGGKLTDSIHMEGKNFKMSDLLVKYERMNFLKALHGEKQTFASAEDWRMAVEKNNPEIFKTMKEAHPTTKLGEFKYGNDQWNLLHVAANHCSFKILSTLEEAGMNWSDQAKDGSTPLTIAAQNDCLQALSYWKEKGADFRGKDGKDMAALDILAKKKDAALTAFAQSFIETRAPASVAAAPAENKVPNFYKKRVIPKDNLADRAHLIEPGDRPDDANETSEYSEFSD
jgi:hypothetical protein